MIRRNSLVLFLALSLAGNICFVSGYIWSHRKADLVRHSGNAVEIIVKQLNLDSVQQQKYIALRKRAVLLRRNYRRQVQAHRAALWELLTRTDGRQDTAETNALIHRMAGEREQYQRKMRNIINAFIDILNEKQKKKFFQLSHENKALPAILS